MSAINFSVPNGAPPASIPLGGEINMASSRPSSPPLKGILKKVSSFSSIIDSMPQARAASPPIAPKKISLSSTKQTLVIFVPEGTLKEELSVPELQKHRPGNPYSANGMVAKSKSDIKEYRQLIEVLPDLQLYNNEYRADLKGLKKKSTYRPLSVLELRKEEHIKKMEKAFRHIPKDAERLLLKHKILYNTRSFGTDIALIAQNALNEYAFYKDAQTA